MTSLTSDTLMKPHPEFLQYSQAVKSTGRFFFIKLDLPF